MPRFFVNRKNPFHEQEHIRLDLLNATAYVTGGFIFITGSFLFLPAYDEYQALGCWLFIIGTLFYLAVSFDDVLKIIRAQDKNLKDAIASFSYTTGGLVYLVGSYYFLIETNIPGAWLFIVGSVLFLIGAFVNTVQIFESPNRESMLLANIIAVTYVIGSTLFLTGSVPYLWNINDDEDERQLLEYLAWQYISGSIMFTLGGAVNFLRIKSLHYHFHSEYEPIGEA